jgi:glycosyltransferase involved in cell wall biosynthesis
LSGNGNKTSRIEAMTTANSGHFDIVPRRGGRHFLGTRGDNPKISVLTVVRNGAATLNRAIESVVGQLNDDIEYVIVDGASTDSTLEIIKAYEDRIAFWVSEPDHGIYDAMNKALAFARGDWIIFLGADDQLNPVLQDIAGDLRDTDAVYYGSVERTVAGGVRGGRFNRYRLMQENICHQAVFYPRRVYAAKPYDTDAGMLADHKYNIELWGSGTRFIHLAHVVSRFNDKGASSSGHKYFEPIKLAAIRSSFGPIFYTLKRARTAMVQLVKGPRGPA